MNSRRVIVSVLTAISLQFGQLSAVSARERVFVALGDANAIGVIDATEDKVIGRIDGVPSAHGLSGTPDGRYLIAGSARPRPAGARPDAPPGVKEEDHVAHHPPTKPDSGSQGATGGMVTIIRQSDLTIVRQIDVRGGVHHVAVSPDSRLAVVTHPREGGMTVIDLDTFGILAMPETGRGANYAAFSVDGSRLYVTNGGDGTVSALKTSNWKIEQTFAVGRGPDHAAVSPNYTHLYVSNADDGTATEVYLIDPRRMRTHTVGANPHGIDVSDDSVTVFVAARADGKLVAINHQTHQQRTLLLTPEPYHLVVVRQKDKLYVSSAKDPMIWVIDTKRLAVLRTITIGGIGHQMVLGPSQ